MSRYILARRHAASRHGRSHVCFMQIKYETWTRMRTNEQWQSAIFKLIFYNVTNFFWSRSLTISDVLPKWFSWKKKNCIYTRLGSDFSLMSYRKGGQSTLWSGLVFLSLPFLLFLPKPSDMPPSLPSSGAARCNIIKRSVINCFVRFNHHSRMLHDNKEKKRRVFRFTAGKYAGAIFLTRTDLERQKKS